MLNELISLVYPMADNKTILGIDPGTNILGYGIISISGNNPQFVYAGIIDMHKLKYHDEKLNKIYTDIIKILDKFHPSEIAIEAPFYGKNVQSMLKLGKVQGIIMGAAISRSIPFYEYSPRKVKMAVTGSGGASKEQVARLLANFLKLKDIPKPLDASDAIAIALCHHFQGSISSPENKVKTWKEFIRKNPGKIK